MQDPAPQDRPQTGFLASRPVQVLLALAAAAVAWRLSVVLLLGFGALLVGITLLAIGDGLRRLAPIPRRAATAIASLLLIGGMAGVIAFYGWRITDQYEVIFAKAKQGWQAALAFLQAHEWSRTLIKTDGLDLGAVTDWIAPALKSAVGTIGTVLACAVIVLVCGVFFALEPERYRTDLLNVLPDRLRDGAARYLDRAGSLLRRWLVSRLIVMGVVGVLSSAGLLLLGIPAAITLGLTGAVLTFIPYLGPILAAAPAVLVAFTASPLLALLTALMFWAVHFIEGTFITPIVQDHEVSLSPVATILGTLAFGVLLGAPGVVLASPLILAMRPARELAAPGAEGAEAPLRPLPGALALSGDRDQSQKGVA